MHKARYRLAREQFVSKHPPSQDNIKAPDFYAKVIQAFNLNCVNKPKVGFIIVAHLVHSLPYFLEAISELGDIVAVIPKKSRVVPQVRDSILNIYSEIIKEIDRDIFSQDQNAIQSLLEKILISDPKWQEHKFIILDHGAYFAPRMYDTLPKFNIIGIVEHTWNGELTYNEMRRKHSSFNIPVLSIAHTKLKHFESDAVGRSIVDAISFKICTGDGLSQPIDRLGCILIIGYGNIGKATAEHFKKRLPKGQRTIYICDTSEIARNEACKRFPANRVTDDISKFLSQADLVITATSALSLTKDHFSSLKSRAIIACATSCDNQFAPDALSDYEEVKSSAQELPAVVASVLRNNASPETQHPNKQNLLLFRHKLIKEKVIYLAAEGGSINFLIGSTGHPILYAVFASVCVNAYRLMTEKYDCEQIHSSDPAKDKSIRALYEEIYEPIIDYDMLGKLMEHGWQLPADNKKKFVGREQLLINTHNVLTREDNITLTQIYALTGMGGIGKTEAAIRYINQYSGYYSIIIWIQAEYDLTEQFTELAKALQIPLTVKHTETCLPLKLLNQILGDEVKRPTADIVREIYKRLRKAPRDCLLVFDNVEALENIEEFLPPKLAKYQSSKVKILVTSQIRKKWGKNEIDVGLYSPQEAIQYIKSNLEEVTEDEAHALARRLEWLPLALAQAVAYLRQTPGVSITRYIEMFDKRWPSLLKQEVRDNPNSTYRATVLTTWNISLEKIRAESQAAITILELCAYIDAVDIPKFLFQSVCTRFQADVNEVVAILDRHSLVELVGDKSKFSIHRLLQEIIQIQQDNKFDITKWIMQFFVNRRNDAEADLINKTLELFSVTFKLNIPPEADLENCLALIAHAQRLVAHAKRCSIKNDALGNVLVTLGEYFCNERRDATHAIEYLQEGQNLLYPDGQTRNDMRKMGEISNRLGFAYYLRGQFDEAIAFCERAQSCYSERDPAMADSIVILGHIAYSRNDLDRAFILYTRALSLIDDSDKKDEVTYFYKLGVLHALGNLYNTILYKKHNVKKAKKYFNEVLAIYEEKNIDAKSIGFVLTLLPLVDIHIKEQDFETAEHILDRAERVLNRQFGNAIHAERITILFFRAALYLARREGGEARELFEQVIRTCDQVGLNNAKVLAHINLSDLNKNVKDKRNYLERAKEIAKEHKQRADIVFIESKIHVLDILEGIIPTSQYKEQLLSQIQRNNFTNSMVCNMLMLNISEIACAWMRMNNPTLAIECLLILLNEYQAELGNHLLTLKTLNDLIAAYKMVDNNPKVIELICRAFSLIEQIEDLDPVVRVSHIHKLANTAYKRGAKPLALAQHTKAVEYIKMTYGGNLIRRYDIQINKVISQICCYLEKENYIPIISAYLELIKSTDHHHAMQIKLHIYLGDFEANNDLRKALEHYKKAFDIDDSMPRLTGLDAAKENVTELGRRLGLQLVFNRVHTCSLMVGATPIHFTYNCNTNLLYCYALIANSIPDEKTQLLGLFGKLLNVNNNLEQTQDLGALISTVAQKAYDLIYEDDDYGIGISVSDQLVLMHHIIDMKRVVVVELAEQFLSFVNKANTLQTLCNAQTVTASDSKKPKQVGIIKKLSTKLDSYPKDIIVDRLTKCYVRLNKGTEFVCARVYLASREEQVRNLAEQNLSELSRRINSELKFGLQDSCSFITSDNYMVDIIFVPNKRKLYVCSLLFIQLENSELKLKVYKSLLEGALLGHKVANGRVGTIGSSCIIFSTIDLRQANTDSLANFLPQFLAVLEYWRKEYNTICTSMQQTPQLPLGFNPNAFFSAFAAFAAAAQAGSQQGEELSHTKPRRRGSTS